MTLIETMMELIRIGICPSATTEKIELDEEQAKRLFLLSKSHDMAHLVGYALNSLKVELPEAVAKKFQQEQTMAVYRYEQQNYELEEICRVLEETKIEFVPLKGSVLRDLYPQAWLRTSCDIDILIHEEALSLAIDALKNIGYRIESKNYHDVSLFSPNNVHLELHFCILENMPNLDKVLKKAWEYVQFTQTNKGAFTNNFFIFHIFAHMAYHFLSGGCGIRSLVDVWILSHNGGSSYETAKELLEQAGIYQFATEINNLVEVCFSQQEPDEFSEQLLSYIVSGGVYGTSKNRIAVKKSKSNSTLKYAWKRVFLPYRNMVVHFPILKKVPILLPFFWIIRFFQMIFGGKSKKVVTELKTAKTVTDDEVNEMQELCSRLGL